MTEREKRGDRWLVGKRDTANLGKNTNFISKSDYFQTTDGISLSYIVSERDVMMDREKRGDRWLVGKRDTANQSKNTTSISMSDLISQQLMAL